MIIIIDFNIPATSSAPTELETAEAGEGSAQDKDLLSNKVTTIDCDDK